MKSTTLNDVDSFLSKTQKFLESNETVNSLILGICLNLRTTTSGISEDPCFRVIESNGDIELVAIMTPPYKMIVSGEPTNISHAIQSLTKELSASGIIVPGILGPVPLAESFASEWSRLRRTSYRKGMDQRLYELTQVVWPKPCPGSLRPVRPDELELAWDWRQRFHDDVFTGDEPAPDPDRTARLIEDQILYFWDDGQPVCMVLKARPIGQGASVGAVYTPPEQRKKGYATSAVARLSQIILDEGKRYCTLYTDLANPISNSIYQKIGYKPLLDFVDFFFD